MHCQRQRRAALILGSEQQHLRCANKLGGSKAGQLQASKEVAKYSYSKKDVNLSCGTMSGLLSRMEADYIAGNARCIV
jgi:hypothetical protein